MRQMPDVAFDADPNTGVAVYDSVPYFGQTGWWLAGGTSLGAPSWSAILADADQIRTTSGEPPLTAAGFATQKAVYSLPASVLASGGSRRAGDHPGGHPAGTADKRDQQVVTITLSGY